MTLFPKDDENITFKDVIIFLSILIVLCLLMYLHMLIKNIFKRRRRNDRKSRDECEDAVNDIEEEV